MTIMTTIVAAAGSFFNREEYYATLTAFPKVPLIIVGGFLLALMLIVYGLQPTPSPPLELLQELLLPAMIQTLPLKFRRRTKEEEVELEETLTIHLIVLVPGLLSPPTGMGNTKVFLDQLARQYNYCASLDDSTPNKKHMIIFRSNSNLGWETTQGILTCGERLAEEINIILKGFAKTDSNHHPPISTINLSLIGNSLGGLISRAALPHIHWNTASNSKIRIVPKLFSTTNTPHLGSKHCSTVVVTNLPRLLQKLIDVSLAKVFKKTGDDLFWFSDTMELLNNDPKYLQPLAAFEQRIAYGNCFRTDLQVPAASSLFLSKTSRSVHRTISTTTSTSSKTTNNATDYYFDTQNFPFAIHAVKTTTPAANTRKAHDTTKDGDNKNDTTNNYEYHNHQCTDDIEDWMKLYCENLDSLGWIKVFCDTRSVLPYLPIPTMLQMVLTGHDGTTTTTTTKKDDFFLLERLDHISEWTSSCLFHAYHLQHGQHLHNYNTSSKDKDTMDNDGTDDPSTNGRRLLLPERWYPPMAHNILMATMSKTPKYLGGEYYTQRGMPFVEEYAKRIVQQCTSTTTTATTSTTTTTTTTDKKTN